VGAYKCSCLFVFVRVRIGLPLRVRIVFPLHGNMQPISAFIIWSIRGVEGQVAAIKKVET